MHPLETTWDPLDLGFTLHTGVGRVYRLQPGYIVLSSMSTGIEEHTLRV
jgi:hypothetical protein